MNGSNPWPLVATAVALVLVTSLLIAVVAWTAADVEWPVPAHASGPSRSASRIGAAASQATAMSPPPPFVAPGDLPGATVTADNGNGSRRGRHGRATVSCRHRMSQDEVRGWVGQRAGERS